MLKILYSLKVKGYLYERGWMSSAVLGRPVDKSGNPIPWVTLSFLDFIEPRLRADFRIFEYGSGNSSIYYGRRVQRVVSVESSEEWFSFVKSKVPPNVCITLKKDLNEYVAHSAEYYGEFDLIVIDGLNRYDCLKPSLQSLKQDGVIVLDNSNRIEYKNIYQFLNEKGFKWIDFWGLAPGSSKNNCTTLFYRQTNCLGV